MARTQTIDKEFILQKVKELKINEEHLSYEEALKVIHNGVGEGNKVGTVEEKLKIASALRTVICHEKGMDESKIHYRLLDDTNGHQVVAPSASWNTPSEDEQGNLFGVIKISTGMFSQRKNRDFIRILAHEFGHGNQFFTNDPVLKNPVIHDKSKKGIAAKIDSTIKWQSNDAEIAADKFAADKYFEWIEGYARSGGKKGVVLDEKARHVAKTKSVEAMHRIGKSIAWTLQGFKNLFGKNKQSQKSASVESQMGH